MHNQETGWTRRLTRASLVSLVGAMLVVTGAGPFLDGPAVEARKRERRTSEAAGASVEAIPRFFSNTTPIAIVSNQQTAPSTIEVSGFTTEIVDVNVGLNTLSHPTASDLDVLLVGPGGQTALIMSDAGDEAANDSLIFDDQAGTPLPSSDPLTSGRFQPTNYDFGSAPDTFAPPAPNPGSGSALAVFNGTNPNGAWRLFIKEQDNLPVENGSLAAGWSLFITVADEPPTPTPANGAPTAAPDSFQAQAGNSLNSPTSVLSNDSDPNGDALTAILAGQPKQGSVTLQPDGSFTYIAKKTAKGTDSFTYLAQDPDGRNALATVDIQIKQAKKKGKGKSGKK